MTCIVPDYPHYSPSFTIDHSPFTSYLAAMTISELYQLYLQHPSIQTDTRKLKEGDIFFYGRINSSDR